MYKFDEDYNGNVLAEASENFNESFLNHHFPASIYHHKRENYMLKIDFVLFKM
jgi:light-regulated signal transduction histidine kinase (bacteriophytochrome)